MVKCCVSGCKVTSTKDVTYFKFPAKRSLRRKWEAAIKLSGRELSDASVCSRHFRPADYDHVRGKMRLKAAVVPSVFAAEVKNSIINNIPTEKEIADETKIPSPEREEDPEKDRTTESNDSDTNQSSPKEQSPDKDTLSNKDVSPIRENSPQEDRITDKDKTLETDKEVPLHNDTPKTNGVTEKEDKSEEIDPEKDNSYPEKDINNKSNDKIDSIEKDICNTDCNDLNVSKQSDIKKDLSATEKDNKRKGKKNSKTEIVDNNKTGGSIDENQDIEELLTDYRIYQNNIHKVEDEITLEIEPENDSQAYDGDLPLNADPVFIELAVDKESANDCLMVLESVQCEIDPTTLLENQDFEVASDDLDDDDDDDDVREVSEVKDDSDHSVKDSHVPKEPISLLTSSDEDDVIIQEPKIDTVEVSDETDEDDKPLVQLVKKKKKKVKKKRTSSDEFKRLLWGMYYCVECHFRTNNKNEYNKHRLEHTKVLLMCQLCGYMTSSESQLQKHEKQHKDFKRYQCHLCEYKAKHNMSLVYHMRSHKEKKSYTCFKCGYLTVSETESVKHVMMCKGVDGKRHRCDKCDYRTSKPSDLRRHKSRRHKDSDSEDEYVP